MHRRFDADIPHFARIEIHGQGEGDAKGLFAVADEQNMDAILDNVGGGAHTTVEATVPGTIIGKVPVAQCDYFYFHFYRLALKRR